jgi:hypothetical protein
LIRWWKEKNIKELFSSFKIDSSVKLEKLIKSSQWEEIRDWIEYWTCWLKPIIEWLSYNNFEWNNELIENNLFRVKTKTSSIFNHLLDISKKFPEKDIYNIINTDINDKFKETISGLKKYETKEIKENFMKLKPILDKNNEWNQKILDKLNINTNQLELAIYLRYGHVVDYPEIWEYITLFLNKYIKEWYSKYLSWIRLIPREKELFPRSWFFEWNKIEKYPVEWNEFDIALKKNSIPFHLSHSIYKDTEGLPHIISWWMYSSWNEYEIDWWLELEKKHDDNQINKKWINNILKQMIKVMQELDKKLDQKVNEDIKK